MKLPENGTVPLTKEFVEKMPFYVDHFSQFKSDLNNLTLEFLKKFDENSVDRKDTLKDFFVGVGLYIANDLFGAVNNDVRTHFRVLQDGMYRQWVVILGNKASDDKISDIPIGKSMIDKSFESKKSLVASLNPEIKYETKTKWEDYMTIAYQNIQIDGKAYLSMGISIKYAAQYQDVLYFLNYCEIEDCLQINIDKINSKCNIIETLDRKENR